MKPVYVIADNIYSPLGTDTQANLEAVKSGSTGIQSIDNKTLSATPFYAAVLSAFPAIGLGPALTRFESLCISSVQVALSGTSISLADDRTIFILSSTKGNIDLLEGQEIDEKLRARISLSSTAALISHHFNGANPPLVVSSACISGLSAIMLAQSLLSSGTYTHAVVTGADILSGFVVSGFQSLSAMSSAVCRPFDRDRSGINLGECAATVVLTTAPAHSSQPLPQVRAGSVTNDANHISGPSRTGVELSQAIMTVMSESGISATDLSFISAHGTATVYNDEMEAKAFTLAGLADIPTFSVKANFGHTLGAAGVLESILTYRSLSAGLILPSKNFAQAGTSQPINISTLVQSSGRHHALKTASGFGGCNAAIIYSIN